MSLPDTEIPIRHGTASDAASLSRLINRAYEVERFFVDGDRTSPEDVLERMRTGTFLVAAGPEEAVAGCVYVEIRGNEGSFGMLAVDPAAQRRGLGGRLIEAAERHARQAGCRVMEIQVVNVREDLRPRYRRLGYVETGTGPYVHRPTRIACHFVVMQKPL